ncbi:MAG: EI24 domain-containing protein [Victivallales bacterium]|nr:EI24 domain-containing protein [Victivallales bacterium]
MGIFSDILGGAKTFFTGFKLLAGKPRYWHYILWPLLFSLLIYGAGFYSYFTFLHPYLAGLLPEPEAVSGWYRYLLYPFRFLVNISVVLFGVVVILLTLTTLYSILAAPFFDFMILKIEKDCYNFTPPLVTARENFRYLLSSMGNALRLNLQTLFWAVLLFPFSLLIPYAGTLLYSGVIGYFFGLSLLMYSAEHRALSRVEVKKFLRGRRCKILGFGVMAYFFLFIPFSALILLPAAAVGGAVLFNEEYGK